ncbi:MAG: DinB family protein [Candidatus Korobacteraceae bacterium]
MTRPISPAAINELFNYSYWARDCQLQACAALTEEQFLRSLGSSFASVRDTLVHMVETEWIWLERWRGRPRQSTLSPEELPSLNAVSAKWRAVEHDMRAYLATLSDETLEQPVTYMSQKGDTFTYELWRPMLHLVNHQSYHRGQVTTLLRQLGLQPPTVDFLPGYRMGFRAP